MFFLEQLAKWAAEGRTAIRYGGDSMTFAQLDARSDAFAAWLLRTYGDDRTPVVLCGHKELAMPVCMYGALKAGRAYVPVDVTFPADRVARILEQVQPQLVVNLSGVAADAPLVLDAPALESVLSQPAGPDRAHWVQPQDPAYILFTSGSTGNPKGVQITAGNIAAFLQGVEPWFRLDGEGGVFLNEISYSFDVSVCPLYYGLSHGMTLWTVDRETLNDTKALFQSLESSAVSLWVSTPSLGEICLQSPRFCQALLPRTQKFVFCGEVMTCRLGAQMLERFPEARIYNAYGPTETTVLVTAAEITPSMCDGQPSLPIGYSFSNVECRILDPETREPKADGEAGELTILGDCVSPGYFRQPEQTARSFFTEADGRRGYRTGDLCCRRDGLIYYFGRLDGQVKLNGFRVELEDVEANLLKVPNIARAAVVPVTVNGTVQGLTAFVMLQQPDGLSSLQRTRQIRQALGELVPSYMVPRKIRCVDSFPLNTNGKIDRKALLAMV